MRHLTRHLGLATLVSLALAGCVILEDNPKKVPVPVPTPQPQPQPVPFPGSGLDEDPGTDVLWLLRMDRGTANLASAYEGLLGDAHAVFEEAGLKVRTVAVGSLYDGTLLWAAGPSAPPSVGLTETLRFHSARAPSAAPTSCTTHGLATLGDRLSAAQVGYPGELVGGEGAGPFRPFANRASAFLVFLVDSGARPEAHNGAACAEGGRTPADHLGSADPATWLRLTGGATLSRTQTRFGFVHTAEGMSDAELRSHCLAQGEFPPGGLDALTASPQRFFESLSAGLNAHEPQLATSFDLCRALADDWPSDIRAFTEAWVPKLKALAPPPEVDDTPSPGEEPEPG